jgi:5-methyltetrahydropteroyltriglutamate--homocysteine methyltransferase
MNSISVIGYPRLGEKRELKFAVEAYMRGEMKENEVFSVIAGLKIRQWELQKKYGVDYISSGDFSLYDNMLDTTVMLNAVPPEYNDAPLGLLDRYLAMARGCQRGSVDLKPFGMKKWFNTNYHYLVPVLNDNIQFRLDADRIVGDYLLAKSNMINTKPAVIGPFTFIKLAKIMQEERSFRCYAERIKELYAELFNTLDQHGIPLLQVEEPALAIDLTKGETDLFRLIYDDLLKGKGRMEVLLQTYFGDIRDIHRMLFDMDFDAFGLDFVDGPKNLDLIKSCWFPSGKKLFAGIVNGKNIWKNDYAKSLQTLDELAKYIKKENIVLSTSCSLLHVPYTLDNESAMDARIKRQLAFAKEKLVELQELSELFGAGSYENSPYFRDNREILKNRKRGFRVLSTGQDKGVLFPEAEITRKPSFDERIKKQEALLGLPMFPTTTIGSFPQTDDVRKNRRQYKKGEISFEQYESFIREKISGVISLQKSAGLDILVHGEYERNDMVEYFAENLDGFLLTSNGWVQSYGYRGVKPPIIFGQVKRRAEPITVKWTAYAQSLADRPVKGMLTGPTTIINWSFPMEDYPVEITASEIARAIRDEIRDLEAAGIKVIQVDEAALREKLPLRKEGRDEYLDCAVKAFRLAVSSAKAETQIHTHMCYSEFSDIMDAIKNMDVDVITIESARSDLSILQALKESKFDRRIGPGVYDIHSPRIPSVEEICGHIEKIMQYVELKDIWINPDCGLKTRGLPETVAGLDNMVEAAKVMRNTTAGSDWLMTLEGGHV